MSQIEELRKIIVGDSSDKLDELRKRIENVEQRSKDVAEVLAPAIDNSISKNNNLVEAFRKPVLESLKKAVRAEPVYFSEILYPAMGPAIRLAIAQALNSMMNSINQMVESATSAKGLSLRWKSLRTGIPYAELALRDNLKYRVEHAYLIERDSGELIAELASLHSAAPDSDALSAMFSAIQSFVQDSFSQNKEDRLTDFKVGEYTVWVAHGSKLMLACVVIGNAPVELKNQMYNTLDEISYKYVEKLASLQSGDAGSIQIKSNLKPLLHSALKDNYKEKRSFGPIMLLLVFLGLIFWQGYNHWRYQSTLNTATYYLKKTPGLLVTDTYWEGNKLVVEGLQDPDSQVPYDLLKPLKISSDNIKWLTKPYYSLEKEVSIKRSERQQQKTQ